MKAKMIKFDNKQYLLRYGFKAFARVENYFEKPLKDINLSNLKMDEVVVLIWAGLSGDLTKDEVETMIDQSDYTIAEITTCMTKAIELATVGEESNADLVKIVKNK